jgi:hypothetical protein
MLFATLKQKGPGVKVVVIDISSLSRFVFLFEKCSALSQYSSRTREMKCSKTLEACHIRLSAALARKAATLRKKSLSDLCAPCTEQDLVDLSWLTVFPAPDLFVCTKLRTRRHATRRDPATFASNGSYCIGWGISVPISTLIHLR